MFEPSKPRKMVTIELNTNEVLLINTLRKYQFGKFVVQKANGVPVRVEINESILLDSEKKD